MFTSERQQLLQEAKVFVKNIPSAATVNELHDHFAQISPDLFVHINTDEKGNRLNFGFVHYMNVKDAETAINKLQFSELKETKLQLSPWMAKEIRQMVQIELRRNLYFRNLPLTKKKVVENSLRQILSQFGEIESMLVKKTQKLNSYYALVSFKDAEAAQSALKELTDNPVTLEGSNEPFHVSWYQRKTGKNFQDNEQLNTVYFHNMKAKVNENTVKEVFEPYGKINYIFLDLFRGGKNFKAKGERNKMKSGYIIFENELQALNALEHARTSQKIRELFVNEPELELISQQFFNTVGPFTNVRANNSNLDYSTMSDRPLTYWTFPNVSMDNSFQSFDSYYFPMNYFAPPIAYPAGFYPYFVNNMFFMPQCHTPTGYPVISNSYNFYHGNVSCEINKFASCTDSLVAEQETGLTSIANLSVSEVEKISEIASPATNTSSSDEVEKRTMVRKEIKEAQTIKCDL